MRPLGLRAQLLLGAQRRHGVHLGFRVQRLLQYYEIRVEKIRQILLENTWNVTKIKDTEEIFEMVVNLASTKANPKSFSTSKTMGFSVKKRR